MFSSFRLASIKKHIISYIFLLLASSNACGQKLVMQQASPLTFSSPKTEVRAVWLTTIGGIDWPHNYANARNPQTISRQQAELCRILDQYRKAGMNTVLVQTRVRGTTIYPSAMEPWDGCLSGNPGTSPGYDALKYVIEECHKRGMECHAWVVTIPVGKWNKKGCTMLRQKYPALIKKIGDDGYMDPENPATGDYLAKICAEITRNYDIDGIHLDYIRYPETWKMKVSQSQGRQYITSIVGKIHDAVKRLKPWVKMSCSPVGKYSDLSRYSSKGWNAYNKVCQDAQGWLRTGYMDALFPMMYFKDNNFMPFAINWKENSYGKIVAPGLGIYFMDPKEGRWQLADVTREMYVLRTIGAGYCFFRSKFFTDNLKGIYSFTEGEFNRFPSLVPAMTWQNGNRPTAPDRMQVDKNQVRWTTGKANNDSPYLTYNLYASRSWPVDVSKAENLVATRLMRNYANLSTAGLHFAVTAMDRYGNESRALQSSGEGGGTPAATARHRGPALLECNGKTVTCPKPENARTDLAVICDMKGHMITSKLYSTDRIDVSRLENGMYELRSLNRKNISRRLGFFQIKRK